MLRRFTKPAIWGNKLQNHGRRLSTLTDEQAAEQRDNASPQEAVKRKRGRPRKTDNDIPSRAPISASLAVRASSEHKDLPTFLDFAKRTSLSPESSVYKGTHYEYTVASALRAFNFDLHRTGRANDLGIDLVGTFAMPVIRPRETSHAPELRVIVQCKAVTPQPSMIRELEGAYVGAPAGWRDGSVLALLVASGAATKGVRAAVQRSRWPMGLMQVTKEGWSRQWIWNAAAAGAGLEGVGVVARHGLGENEEGHGIAMTWMGKVIKKE